MKRLVALLLVCVMIISGCGNGGEAKPSINPGITNEPQSTAIPDKPQATTIPDAPQATATPSEIIEENEIIEAEPLEFTGLSDADLLRYVEDNIYVNLVEELDSAECFVQNVEAIYLSKEYLEEVAYNSQKNVFFGYTLAELEEQFQGTRYVFTLGEDGTTTVKPYEDYDDTYEKVIKNVAIGTGVILICVTVSFVTGGAGAPAASMIFAASAKSGAIMALSSGAISGVAAGVVTGIKTNDFDQAAKAAALAGSEGFKWGAISGAIAGGVSEAAGLYGATLTEGSKLTMNDVAIMQKESKYPLDIIKQFKSVDEYNIYRKAGLKTQMVDGKLALTRQIDLNFKSDLNGETVTNLQRMAKGYAPLDPATGKAYQLHHIGQKADATLAVLTEAEHQGNASILNMAGKTSEIDRKIFAKVVRRFWKDYAAQAAKALGL